MQIETPILRWERTQTFARMDTLAVEEPLEIRVNAESLTVTMRTPGDDFALAAGFLFAEGLLHNAWDIGIMGHDPNPHNPERHNTLHITLQSESPPVARTGWERRFPTTSSCGVCGKTDLQSVQCLALPLPDSAFRVPFALLSTLNDQMRSAQQVFERTGGLHAAALFDREGTLLSLKEDIGRHNAVDKLIGTEVLTGRMPLSERILLISGRASFEIMQKAAVARIPLVCAVSAPSSLAVHLAQEMNMTLVGFLRGDTFNVYTGAERLLSPSPATWEQSGD